jgi:hypothetical protein
MSYKLGFAWKSHTGLGAVGKGRFNESISEQVLQSGDEVL